MFFLRHLIAIIVGLLVVSITVVNAADCPEIVKNALDTTNTICSATGRNQACYGNVNLTVEAQSKTPEFNFTKPGDLADITGVKKLILSPLDANANSWGIALLKVQANLPDTLPGQNVSFVLFGDVQIDNAVDKAPTLDVTTKQTANVRQSPAKTAPIMTSAQTGTALVADGRSDDTAWLRVHSADLALQGWVSSSLVQTDGDLNTLAVVNTDSLRLSPMQAFYFKSGLNDAPCGVAPDSGILIQTPKGAGKISLTADDVQIILGSTAYIQAQAGGELTISVIEGQATVTAAGVTVTVPAGTRARVPLDNALTANGAPTGPEPYDDARMAVLPIGLLSDAITITPSLTAEAIASAAADIQPLSGTWTAAADVVNFTEACGPGLTQVTHPTTFTAVTTPYDLAQIIALSGERLPLDSLHPTQQGNTYTVDYEDAASQVHIEVIVLSTTAMQRNSVNTSKSQQGCVITASGTFEYVGS